MTLLREGTAEDAGFHAQNIEAIGKQIRRWVDAGTPRTLVALIARNGVIALQEAAGPMTSEPDSPDVQLDSVFPASSLAKPITAAAILMLVEDGLIGLNRPVREYIPEIAGVASDDLMLIHLLTHTSGYDEDKVGHMVTPRPKAPKDLPPPDSTLDPRLQRWLAARYPIAPLRPPGTLMEYCNYNYELLGEIVRRVSAMPFDSFVRERIFEPLG
ncbi:MAG: serine hydrolase, partial [Gammaproteobacteria bacterium]|nr:serine hydrolase [Gammaproteobacteria bacterium]